MIDNPRQRLSFKNLLFLFVNKEFLIFLFFLAFSGVFWLFMTLNGTYEKELKVIVSYDRVPKNVVLTSENTDTITVTVKDKGFALLTYMTNKQMVLSVPFDNYANRATCKGTVGAAELTKMLYTLLYSSSRVTVVKPDRLEFFFNNGQARRVPIKFEGKVVPAQNYYLADMHVSPDSVLVYAHKSIIDSIKTVRTVPVNLTNFDDTVTQVVALQPVKGMKVVPKQVKVSFYPDILTEESVEVPITAINMPEGKVLRTFPSKVTVRFTVGASMFRNVQADQFRVITDYNDIAQGAEKCQLHITAYPPTVMRCVLVTPSVDYLIEQQ